MAVLCFQLLAGQSLLNVPLLGVIFEGRQSLLELPDVLLLSSSALPLILTHTRQAFGVLHKESQAPAFWVILGGLAVLAIPGGQRTFWLLSASIARQFWQKRTSCCRYIVRTRGVR